MPVLIVSISGDGGFNDVVNGVMDVPESTAVCTVLGAGNANDHRRSVATMSVVDAIVAGPIRRMDLLKLVVCDVIAPTLGAVCALLCWIRSHRFDGAGLKPPQREGCVS